MYDQIADRIVSVKNHIKKHRAKYAALGTAYLFLKLIKRNARELDAFLIEHNIDPNIYWLSEE